MLKRARSLAAAAGTAAVLVAGAAGALTATSAQASSLSCTGKTACGGATLAYNLKGTLALAVLAPDPNTNGGFGYWNEPVGVNTEDFPAGTGAQDFTVAQVAGERPGQGGQFGFGEYLPIYTPGGNLPNDPIFGAAFNSAKPVQTAYCLSVQDLYRMVRGHLVQRWATVLRPCGTYIGGPLQLGPPAVTDAGTTIPPVVNGADPYQLWAPVEVAGQFFEFQNIGLDNSSFYRHGFGGENFVLDDTAFGGPGTQALAFQENDQANQQWKGIGCTLPLTAFNPAYFNCPTGTPAPAPTVTVAAFVRSAAWAGAASATVPHHLCTVTITDQLNGTPTTGSYVYTGEVILVTELLPSGRYGPVAYRITVIRDRVPDEIGLFPSLPRSDRGNEVFGVCSPGGLNPAARGMTRVSL